MNDVERNKNLSESDCFNPDIKIKKENFDINLSEVYDGENFENKITEQNSGGERNSDVKMKIKSEYEDDSHEDDDDFLVNRGIFEPKVGFEIFENLTL